MIKSIRSYIEDRQSMGKCQTLLAFLVVCGIMICILTVVMVLQKRASRPSEAERAAAALAQAAAAESDEYDALKHGKRTRKTCERLVYERPDELIYGGKIGTGYIATLSEDSGAIRNAFWLTGEPSDELTFAHIRVAACQDKVPVVVVKMRPREGFQLNDQLVKYEYYKPASNVTGWETYDERLQRIIDVLGGLAAIIVMEPDLFMYIVDERNSQYKWSNSLYTDKYLERCARLVKALPKSWIYMDVGHPYFLDRVSQTADITVLLLRLPGIRGFAINTMHFANKSYTEWVARDIHCKTGLNYIVDTSRNGGALSKLVYFEIENCMYDPPGVAKGATPGWNWGSRTKIQSLRVGEVLDASEALAKKQARKTLERRCLRTSSTNRAQDANVWIKTPGVSDGRLYDYGSYKKCLMTHAIPCNDFCPMLRYSAVGVSRQCQCYSYE